MDGETELMVDVVFITLFVVTAITVAVYFLVSAKTRTLLDELKRLDADLKEFYCRMNDCKPTVNEAAKNINKHYSKPQSKEWFPTKDCIASTVKIKRDGSVECDGHTINPLPIKPLCEEVNKHKIKARDIYDKFMKAMNTVTIKENSPLIAVIKLNCHIYVDGIISVTDGRGLEYWNKVEDEIEKL